MAATAPASLMRKLINERFSQCSADLETLFETEATARVSDARRELCESFNQALRRLRHAADFDEAAAVLVDAALSFCGSSGVFRVVDDNVHGVRVRGVEHGGEFTALSLSLQSAPALRTAVETGDPVVAAGTPAEISAGLAKVLSAERVHLFPLTMRGKVTGLVCAAGVTQPAGLEALAQAAGAALEARTLPPAVGAELIGIQPAGAAEPAPPPEQRLHLRAQRFARVQVAEMRLYRAEAVKSGRDRSDLYQELKDVIDAAREIYRREFLGSAELPDYLHLELLHTLANDDVRLLGEKYPGPLGH